MQINFNIDVLRELVAQQPHKASHLIEKFPKINEWKENVKKPTLNQLGELANFFHIPFGYFFLKSIPVRTYPIPDYRTIKNEEFKPSTELLENIKILERRQEWAKELLKEFKEPLPFANSIDIKTDIEVAAQKIRDILKLPINWTTSENLKDWKEAFRLLLDRTEAAGIYVVINGGVDHDQTKRLDIKEFRGFVLYDNYAPFLFINGNDFITGKIFTIIHEIVHVLIGESASFDFKNLMPAKNNIETFCNAVTAEFLVPKVLLQNESIKKPNDYERLSLSFKVSRIVIARRLLDLNKITYDEFVIAYRSFYKSEIDTTKAKGGIFYYAAPYRISREFFNLVYQSVKNNKLLYRDAFRLTGLKAASFDGYIKDYY